MADTSATASIISPIGTIVLAARGAFLTGLTILPETAIDAESELPVLIEGCAQLRSWFARERRDFNLPLLPLASPRGNALRAGMAAIGYGETLSYGALAEQLGSAPRAIGQACRRNPFPIIIPCHRVTSRQGPEYYSGGAGPQTKAWLIAFEKGEI